MSAVALFAGTQCPKASIPAAAADDPADAAAAAPRVASIGVGGVGSGAAGDGSGDGGVDVGVNGMAAEAPAMSLNFCVTDGRHIVCSRYRNHSRQEPPSLFVLSGAGFACEEEGSCLQLTAPGVFVCLLCRYVRKRHCFLRSIAQCIQAARLYFLLLRCS